MTTTYESNVDDVHRSVMEAITGFNFHKGGSGWHMVEAVADGIQERSADRQMAAVQVWYANEPIYRAWKQRKYGTDKTNYRTGQMLSRESLLGVVVIDTNTIEIRYGTGRPPAYSENGYMEDSDRQTTDIEKAYWASQDDRQFFELDDRIKDHTFQIFTDAFGDHIRNCV